MPNALPLTPCKKYGCRALVRGRGYCPEHAHIKAEVVRENFDFLERKKTDEERAFYQTHRWHETSRRHRIDEPLCLRCRADNRIVPATLVHHNPPLSELLARGEDPHADKFLESLCLGCHQRELRAKRYSGKT